MRATRAEERLSVWIVDTSETWPDRVCLLLQEFGFDTHSFHAAEECLTTRSDLPAVIVAGTLGFDDLDRAALFALCRLGRPVILLTSPFDLSTATAAFRLGAADVAERSVSMPRLALLISSTLGSSRREKARRERVLGAV